MLNSKFLFIFALVCLICNATASPSPPLSQTIESCFTLLFTGLTDCYDYLEKGPRRHDHPSSSCCTVLRDAWKVDPECVNSKVLDGFIVLYYVGFDSDTTRLDRLSSTCGIGLLKSNPPSRPPVASSPLEARPPVQPNEGSPASTPMALSGDANSSSQNSSDLYFWYLFWFSAMWVAFLY